VRVYVGGTRSEKHIKLCVELGLGECCTRGHLPPSRGPWCMDNGAYSDFRWGRPFSTLDWDRDVRWLACAIAAGQLAPPDFTVMPDIVGGGAASLAMSIAELTGMPDELPVRYLVVQEGMSEGDVAGVLDRFHGIFVGGAEMSWKVTTAPRWVALAHAAGKLCHIGRIGTPRRLEWAASVGADSVDSNWPLSSTERLVAFGEAARRAGALSRVERYAVAGSRRRRWLSGRGSNWRLPARRRW
jgi:hypothetical protein